MIRVNRLIITACIFHNLLISLPYVEDWLDEDGLDDEDELNLPTTIGNEARRTQILHYLLERNT
jgi:hypothetical protein